MTFLFALVFGIIGAFARRMVGGLWLTGNIQIKRLIGATMNATAVAVALWGAPWFMLVAAASIPCFWAGMTAGYNLPGGSQTNGAMRMGRDSNGVLVWPKFFEHFGIMLYHGLYMVAPVALLFLGYHFYVAQAMMVPWWMLAGGLLCAPCYALAWVLRINDPALGMLPNDAPPAAEFMSGALRLIAVYLQFVGG